MYVLSINTIASFTKYENEIAQELPLDEALAFLIAGLFHIKVLYYRYKCFYVDGDTDLNNTLLSNFTR